MNGTIPTTRNALQLAADPRRVIVKLFMPGEDAVLVHRRTHALVDRIAGLDDEEADRLLRQTLARSGRRHRDLEDTFRQHYEVIRHQVSRADALSPAGRLLIGAYCSHEYAVEGAALCNPSVVEHADQSGLDDGELRVVISLRQIGEGHLSSVGFASAVVGPAARLVVADRSGPLVVGRRTGADHRRDLLAAGITDAGANNEISAGVLDALPAFFDEAALERAIGLLPSALHSRVVAQGTLEQLRRTNADSYATAFPTDTLPHHARRAEPMECTGTATRPSSQLGTHPGRQLRPAHRDARGLARAHPRRRARAAVRHRSAPTRPAPSRRRHCRTGRPTPGAR